MNELIRIENGEVKLDSRMIAEHFDKEHKNVLADIRDEAEKLDSVGLQPALIFQPSHYTDKNGQARPCYEMSEEGALQLAARYDAVSRRKLIIKIKELKSTSQPKCIEDLIIMQAQSLKDMRESMNQLTGTVETIKETVILQPDHWREDINRMFNRVSNAVGENKFRELRHESYKLLESMAHVNLEQRLTNLTARMFNQGATKTALKNVNKLDVIESDPKLREIYAAIIKEYTIKFVA